MGSNEDGRKIFPFHFREGSSGSYLKLGGRPRPAEMPGIAGGHTWSRRPEKAAKKVSSVIRVGKRVWGRVNRHGVT